MQPPSGISEGRAAYKSGKLIKVHALFRDDEIVDIKITGDFFLYPEEKIENIERKLRNRRLNDAIEVIEEEMKDTEYEGISPEALWNAIREAWMRRK